MHDPDRLRAPPERSEQIAPRLRGVVDRNCLAGEQEREVEVVLDERLCAETLRELGGLGVARLAPLDEGVEPARDRRREQERHAGEQRAESSVRAPGLTRLLLGRLTTLGDEGPLELV